MKILLNKKKITKFIDNRKKIGFVPTMGAIHSGHISLIKKSISECDKTIVSIFINKPQFNRKSDYKKYPRQLEKDIFILKKNKVDYLYLPKYNEIYPPGKKKKIKINKFEKKLCGKFRPNHFKAVVDVIERFIKIINPKKIYLGEKDMQQLKIIDDYVKKNLKYVKVVACRTIREDNGLALSSRNFLLSKKEKIIGAKIYKFFKSKKSLILNKRIDLNYAKNYLLKIGVSKIDYIKIIDINKIIKPYKKIKKKKIFIAYYLRKTRLIDNI